MQVGDKTVSEFDYSGFETGTVTSESEVLSDNASFNGIPGLWEIQTRSNGTITTAGVAVNTTTEGKIYSKINGSTSSDYGSIMTSTMSGLTGSTIKTIYNPPYTDNRWSLAVGETGRYEMSGTATVTTPYLPEQVVNLSGANLVKFVGMEMVTIPAGTFNACKYEESSEDTPADITTNWLYKGHPVKSYAETPAGKLTIELKSALINGAPLQ